MSGYKVVLNGIFLLLLISWQLPGKDNKDFVNATFDVFPLKNGSIFQYQYSLTDTVFYVGTLKEITLDSGNYKLEIKHWSQNQDTKTWTVEMNSNIVRHCTKYNSYAENGIEFDSVYTIQDTVMFEIYESLLGTHELMTSTIPMLWDTIAYSRAVIPRNVWSFPSEGDDDYQTIYRFSDSPQVTLGLGQWPNEQADSLWFEENTGLSKRHYHSTYSGNHQTHTDIYYELSDYIVSVDGNDNVLPRQYQLLQNYPNPFNPVTRISYKTSQSGNVSLKIFNLLGVEVATLYNGVRQPGNYTVIFDASDLPSGAYFYQLKANQFTTTKKMLLIK